MKPGDIDLMDLSQFDHGVPHEYLGVLRREDPVHWQDIPGGQGFYAITKHADLRHISRNPQMFSSWKGGTNLWDRPEEELGGLRSMMLNMDPPQHVKYRRLVQPGFTPKMVALLEPRIREAARAVLDAVVDKNECDFVTELASELPLVLICELMGIPQEKRQDIFEWSNTMIGFDDPELSGDGQMGAAGKMWMYANELAASKRTNPDDSLVSKMINGSVDGDQISELEFNNFFVLLSVAGNETTRTVTTHGMRLLMEHRDQYDLLQAHPEHIPTAVEEFLRYNPPVIYFRRTLMQDTELRGVELKTGDKVAMFYPAANRDEEVFAEPERFDVTRDPNPHLSFGIGEHYCLGANLARMQLHCIFSEILGRLRNLEPAGPVRYMRGNFVDGVKEMRVKYEVAA
jgi:cholest-4-en-3-one 26-monooxygenase